MILSLSSIYLFLLVALLVCFCFHFWVKLVLCFVLFNMFLFVYFSVFVYFVFDIKINKKIWKKSEKYKNSVCFVYIGTCVPWMAIETKFSKLCISCSLDEHLYAQLSEFCGSCMWWVRLSCLLYLTLVSLFLTGRTKKSWEKDINNHLTTIAKVQYQWHLYASA